MIHTTTLVALSHDGRIYRAFGHLLVAHTGALVAVPLAHVDGWLADVVDGCPVPWLEALLVTEAQACELPVSRLALSQVARDHLTRGEGGLWQWAPLEPLCASVFIHQPDGLRIALANDIAIERRGRRVTP